ncbi:MAG TPA: hypothetical protein VFW94_13170 [Candidatus Acidoferrales bacterium]|nr:hypothetical protein [Candidatus Acidoferrales bacterium]
MRRAQAILVLLALAALPLVPLVQASQMDGCTCTLACCMRQRADSASNRAQGKNYCQRQGVDHVCDCGMMSRTALEFVLAPIPPALMLPLAVLAPPSVSLAANQQLSQHSIFGFSREVFEPPRG